MPPPTPTIFTRLLSSGRIAFDDPEYPLIFEAVSRTIELSVLLNTATSVAQIRERLSAIIGQPVEERITVLPRFTPFSAGTSIRAKT